MRTRVRTHEACRTWHTYVRTYVRTDVRRRAHFSAARIARAAPTSAAKPRNIPNNVRTYVPKAWGIVVHARKKQTHTRTHTHKRVFVAGRNESSAVAWLIASKTSDARMAGLVHKNSPTVTPYLHRRNARTYALRPTTRSPRSRVGAKRLPPPRGHRVRRLRAQSTGCSMYPAGP